MVKPAAFLPSPISNEVSTFRIAGLSEQQIRDLGDRAVGSARGKTVRGRAEVLVRAVRLAGNRGHGTSRPLSVVSDDSPPRHAAIRGWPKEKDRQKLLALEIANAASLHLRTDS